MWTDYRVDIMWEKYNESTVWIVPSPPAPHFSQKLTYCQAIKLSDYQTIKLSNWSSSGIKPDQAYQAV